VQDAIRISVNVKRSILASHRYGFREIELNGATAAVLSVTIAAKHAFSGFHFVSLAIFFIDEPV